MSCHLRPLAGSKFASTHHQTCSCITFSPNGQQLASGSHDTSVKVWDLAQRKCVQTYKLHTNNVNTVLFSPDGRWLLSGGEDGLCLLMDLNKAEIIKSWKHDGLYLLFNRNGVIPRLSLSCYPLLLSSPRERHCSSPLRPCAGHRLVRPGGSPL